MKTTTLSFISLLLAGGLLAGCGKGPEDMVVKPRDNPQHGWVMRVDLREAPSQPKLVEGYASYETIWSGEPCPSKNMARWGTPVPWEYDTIAMTQVEPGIYEGTFYLDRWQDDVYFDRGLCAWRLNTAGVSFSGPGGKLFGNGIGYRRLGMKSDNPTEGLDYYLVEDWTRVPKPDAIKVAMSVPRNDFKDDPTNARVNDRTVFFPIRIFARPLENSPGLGVREEFKARTGQDIE